MTRTHRILLAVVAAALTITTAAAAAATKQQIRVHAIFGGHGAHVGQVLDVQATGGHRATRVCWDPAPIDRPACSASRNGAPSATGTTKLTLTMPGGTTLTRTIKVGPAYKKAGGRGGSDAAPGHITCSTATLYGNTGPKLHDPMTKLKAGDAVAIYNKVGKNALFVWHYADNKAGFAKPSCVNAG